VNVQKYGRIFVFKFLQNWLREYKKVVHPISNAFLLCMNKQWDTKHGLALLGLNDMSCLEKSPGRFVCIRKHS
jgi:hypothetical protein